MPNRIEISYQETMNKKILFLDFKMLTKTEIRKKYGEEVCSLYFNAFPNCFKDDSYAGANGFFVNNNNDYLKRSGIYDKSKFEKIVEIVRNSGSRLSEIRKQVKAYETKTIII